MNIQEKISDYLKMNRSPHTIQTYGEALKVYVRLGRSGVPDLPDLPGGPGRTGIRSRCASPCEPTL